MKRDTLIQFFKKHDSSETKLLSTHAKARVKARIMQSLHNPTISRADETTRSWTFFYTKFAAVAVCILVLLTGTAYASSSAIPGDILYPVKRAVEDTRVTLASSSEIKAKLQVQFTEERLQELEKVEMKAPLKQMTTPTKPGKPTPSPSASPTTIIAPEPEHKETQAESTARNEVSKALRRLEQTQKDLHQQGKDSVADDLGKTIRILHGRIRKNDRENSEAKNTDERTNQKTEREMRTDTDPDSSSPRMDRSDSPERRRGGK